MMNNFIKNFIFTLLCFVSVASAQNEIGLPLRGFEGGINNNTVTIALKANESPDAMNVVIDEPWGQAKTRNGFLTCGSIPSGNTITNTHEYIRSNGVHELILTDNTNVYSTIDCVNFSSVTTGLSSIAAPYFDTFRDKLWIVNKSTHAMTWDGTTLTVLDGVGTRPNPPIAQYVTHWKERVWMARTTTEPSAIYFTDLTDESGTNIDPSISSAAWPTLNSIWIAEEDGSPIYGIKVYRDRLFVFKETGIWSIIFESNLDVQVVKAVSNVGCKFQDSIVELDNFLYFVGNDGIYKFDGVEVVRISDNIQATFNRLKQPNSRESFELWDSDTQFLTGTLANLTTTYNPGSLTLVQNLPTSNLIDNWDDGEYTSSPSWTPSGDNYFSATTNKLQYRVTDYISGEFSRNGYMVYPSSYSKIGTTQVDLYAEKYSYGAMHKQTDSKIYFIADSENPSAVNGFALKLNCYYSQTPTPYCFSSLEKCTSGSCSALSTNQFSDDLGGSGGGVYLTLKCSNTKIVVTSSSITVTGTGLKTLRTSGGSTASQSVDSMCSHSYTGTGLPADTFERNTAIILNSSEYYFNGSSTTAFGEGSYFDNLYLPRTDYVSSGTYTSRISTYSSLTAWQAFDVAETLNGQGINYYVKVATSAYNIYSKPWTSITSGQVISTVSASNVFQWKAEFATSDVTKSPTLDAVTANYREGDATSTRLQAINYKNRYMLTGSTTAANNYNDIVLVKTKTPLDNWMVYDWQVSAFSKWNTYLYGGISNSANVARYDYGSNDNGVAINAYWTWGDQHWDRMSYKKNLKEIYAFYLPTQSSANTAISYSYDGGTTWTDKTVDMTGTSAFGTKRLLINGGIGNAFRFKVSNRSLDQSFNLLGLDIWALPYVYRE